MANQRLSTLYYDFMPTSFISQSIPINSVIHKVISNAITGKYTNFDNNEYFPNTVTLTPFVKYMEEKDAVQFIDEFYKKQTKITQKYERNRFCMERNLEIYSKSKATCFLVLGKPTSARYKVAKYLAEKTQRHHIDVVGLVAKEIIKNTPLGNWMWANLVWGKKIPDSIPMMLLLDELGKKMYQRRGYVLSGLPIISSCELNENLLPFALGKFPCVPPPYMSKIKRRNQMKEKESTHVTNIFNEEEEETNVEEITDAETIDDTSEEVSEEEWSSADNENEYPDQEQRRLEFTKQGKYKLPYSEEAFTFSIEQQLSLLLDLDMPPDVVVYLNMEDNEDIITTKPNLADADKLKLLIQLDRYEAAFTSIQNFLLHYSKETMIKIDGRLRQKDLFQQLENRLQYLNYKKIYDVEWLFPTGIPEQVQKSMVGKSLEDSLQILCETNNIKKNLIWLKSHYQTYCPVETCRGKHVRGNLQFALIYLGYIYLLSSYENMKAFISEPEKYIFFQPNCRIALIGPARSGKSTLAKLLKFLLKGEIYDTTQAIYKLCSDNSENKYAQAFQWAFSQAKNLIKTRIEYCINLRTTKLQEWKENVLPQIKQALDAVVLGAQAFSLENIESILLNSKYFNEILPEECKINADYKDLDCSDPIVNFFLHEKLVELYGKSLVENYQLASDFITFAQAEDEKIQINANSDKKYGQWILDGAPLDLGFWEKLQENNFLPDVVIFLSNCSEEKLDEIYGRGLNRNFTSGRYVINNVYKSHCHFFTDEKLKQDEFITSLKLIVPMNVCISKYSKFLASIKFTENVMQLTEIEKLEEYLKSKDIPLLTNNISNSVWGEVMLEVLLKYLSLFKSTARPLSCNDLVKLSEPPIHIKFKNVGNDEEENEESLLEEMEEEDDFIEETIVVSEKNILKNVRLGSLGLYCPVLFTEYDVLIKGRQNICIDYENLIYFFYSQECLSKFIRNPQKYVNMHNKPLVPAVKIWIMGPNTTEKNFFSLLLSEELRTKSITFCKQDFKLTSKVIEETSLDILHDLNDCMLSDSIIKKLKYFLKAGAILTGFPLTKDQFMDMIAKSLYPEAIFIMDDQELLTKALYNKELELRKQKRNTPRNNPVNKKTIDEDEDIGSEIISENTNESNSDKSEYRKLTKSDKREIYELCKSLVDAFFMSERQMMSLASSLNIPVFKIPKNFRNPGFIKSLMLSLYNHHDRSSFFDQVLEVSENIAMLCLDKGIFRYSRFGKSCPVDVENLTTVNHFMGSMQSKRIIPCIYREHIYFINGKKNLCKFKINPFKYVNTCSPYQYNVPLRIAILGPPSSGCTTLCNRISKEFGMRIFAKEDFEALLPRDFHWTKLYQKFIDNNNIITEDILPHCLMLNENATPNGIILDNFQLEISHILKVARYNVDFHIILLLAPTFEDVWGNWCRSTANLKNHSVRQLYILFTAYSDFMKKTEEVMNTTSLQLFNIFVIKHVSSKWASWCTTKSKIFKTIRGIVGFESNIANRKCSSFSYLNIFEYELDARFSPIGPYCPICAINKKLVRYRYDFVDVGKQFYERKCQEEILRPFGYNSKSIYEEFKFSHPWSRNPDYSPLLSKFVFKRNLFLYQNYSYWSCDDHLIELLLNAPTYLPLSRNHLPPYVPLLVLTYLQLFVEYEGMCVVTYFKHLPNKVCVKGDSKYAIYYKGKVFLVASGKEALEFLQEPQKYYRVKIKLENTEDVDWDLEGMKFDLGTLTGSLLPTTIVEVANVRPKHFAMGAMESVAVQMALHLKIQNNALSPVNKIIYQSTLKAFLKECRFLQKRLYKVKKNKNPFIVQEYQDEISENSEQFSRESVK